VGDTPSEATKRDHSMHEVRSEATKRDHSPESRPREAGMQKAPGTGPGAFGVEEKKNLLLVATLVASLTKQLTVLLLSHALASLFDY
jgi:hypothetical protein